MSSAPATIRVDRSSSWTDRRSHIERDRTPAFSPGPRTRGREHRSRGCRFRARRLHRHHERGRGRHRDPRDQRAPARRRVAATERRAAWLGPAVERPDRGTGRDAGGICAGRDGRRRRNLGARRDHRPVGADVDCERTPGRTGHRRSPNRSAACHRRSPNRSAACHRRSPNRSAACHRRSPNRSAACHPRADGGARSRAPDHEAQAALSRLRDRAARAGEGVRGRRQALPRWQGPRRARRLGRG
jgi:hypothetical protein